MTTQTLLLVGHGHDASGRTDPPLSPRGVAEADSVARALARYLPDHVVTTPQRSAVETGRIIAEAANATFVAERPSIDRHAAEALLEERPGSTIVLVADAEDIRSLLRALVPGLLAPDVRSATWTRVTRADGAWRVHEVAQTVRASRRSARFLGASPRRPAQA